MADENASSGVSVRALQYALGDVVEIVLMKTTMRQERHGQQERALLRTFLCSGGLDIPDTK